MLINCPECNVQISDKSEFCIHCGYPFKKKKRRPRKYKRLPNGFGQITELKNTNLRNKFRAMVTVGKKPDGKPICKLLKPNAYFKTYNEAYAALVEYNKDPYSLEPSITVLQLYERWSEAYFKTIQPSSIRSVTAAWDKCGLIYNMEVKAVRAVHMKVCIDSAPTPNIKSRIKSVFNLMFDYAVEVDLITKNYARTFNISENIIREIEGSKKDHISFTEKEMINLWKNTDNYTVCIILIQCYTGLRPQELCTMKMANIVLEGDNKYFMKGGMKTKAGKNRTIPICRRILPVLLRIYNLAKKNECENLVNCFDPDNRHNYTTMTYDKYQYRFKTVIEELGLDPKHRPHDPRKHFVTMAKQYGVDEYAIKRIIGHAISDITESIYTDRDLDWLLSEINKIE